MRRLRLIAVAVAAAAGSGLFPAAAGAWTTPSNAGSAPGSSASSYCVSANDTLQVLASGTTSATGTFASGWQGGVVDVVVNAASGGSLAVSVTVGTGSGENALAILTSRSGGTTYVGQVDLPASASGQSVTISGATSLTSWYVVGNAAANSSAELAEYACLNAAAAANQAHTDAGTIATDLAQLHSDVTSGTTQAHADAGTLAGDLAQVHSDLVTLEGDVSGGPSTAQTVELSPADRQMFADASNGAHNDLWELGGCVLAGWALGWFARVAWSL